MSNIDNYRTKDGNGYFSFSFFEIDEAFEIDVIYSPKNINLANSETCSISEREGFTINTDKKYGDLFTAKLVAADWAEDIWTSSNIKKIEQD